MRQTPAALPWLGIAGPTASGKSALAMAMAAHWAAQGRATEIISVDSALVYRGMDIGTAKPTAPEQAQVPHHLIDIRDPLQAYSAAEFAADATRLIADITARGAIPLLVGGTMLYFKALMDGIDDLPRADPAVRAELEAQGKALGWPAMHAKLALVDAPTAQRLSPNDSQRIQRALEVYRLTGQPMSALFASKTIANNVYRTGGNCLISLEPQDRSWLHKRIAQRFDQMLAAGFMTEVAALRERGDLHPDLPSMRCVGYRQAWDSNDTTQVRELGIIATRQLAKRQITWLRAMPARHVIACDQGDMLQPALALAETFIAAQASAAKQV
jgi:tRNA dimethylallyltransferase